MIAIKMSDNIEYEIKATEIVADNIRLSKISVLSLISHLFQIQPNNNETVNGIITK